MAKKQPPTSVIAPAYFDGWKFTEIYDGLNSSLRRTLGLIIEDIFKGETAMLAFENKEWAVIFCDGSGIQANLGTLDAMLADEQGNSNEPRHMRKLARTLERHASRIRKEVKEFEAQRKTDAESRKPVRLAVSNVEELDDLWKEKFSQMGLIPRSG